MNFFRAYLAEADLGGADLRNADLGKATLKYADLTKADLSGADHSRARNLHEAFFLDEAKHDSNTKWTDGFDPPEPV